MGDISIILNVYKRPYSLENQIKAIKNQSIKIESKDIHIWYNKSDVIQPPPEDKKINTYRCNWNSKFHGRYTIPLLCRTKYIAMFDDDVIPGRDWLKNCLETIKTHPALLGASGIICAGQTYSPSTKVGWNGIHHAEPIEVDLVGHATFFETEWIRIFWSKDPESWDNGEDIMFSYLLQTFGIKTLVPPHPQDKQNLWGNTDGGRLGSDPNASYIMNTDHNAQRDDIVNSLYHKGWQTINGDK